MSSAAQSASLSRSQGAALCFVAFAAGAATFYLGSAYNAALRSQPQPLSRRNAVYRRRPRHEHHALDAPDAVASSEPLELANGDARHMRADDAVTDLGIPDTDADGEDDGEGQKLHELMFAISKNRARTEGFVHRAITCDSCNRAPIVGVRYRCANCPDFDLCEDCEAQEDRHPKTHVFYKIRVPAPWVGKVPERPWYPGRPHLLPRELPDRLRSSLCKSTQQQANKIDAFYVQFSCIANVAYPDDPVRLGAGINLDAFYACFVPQAATRGRINDVFRRIFQLFDANGDGIIGFREFVRGLTTILDRKSRSAQDFIFRAFDGDGDGYITRADCLSFYKAFFALDKDIVLDHYRMMLAGEPIEELEDRRGPADFIKGGRPLTAYFEGPMPMFDAELVTGGPPKAPDEFGDLVPPAGEERLPVPPPRTIPHDDIIRGSWSWGSPLPELADWEQELERIQAQEPPRYLLRDPSDPEVYVEHIPGPAERYGFRVIKNKHYLFVAAINTGQEPTPYRCVFIQVPAAAAEEARQQPETHFVNAVSYARYELNEKIARERVRAAGVKLKKRGDFADFYKMPDVAANGGQSAYESPYGADTDRLCLQTDSEALGAIYEVLQEALNEMLDPIFEDVEALSLALGVSEAARQKYSSEVQAVVEILDSDEREDWTSMSNERLVGDARLWPAILQARRSRISDPSRLFSDVTKADLRFEREPRWDNSDGWCQRDSWVSAASREPAWPEARPKVPALTATGRDPTLPQNRPSSARAEAGGRAESDDDDTVLVSKEEVRAERFAKIVVSLARLQKLDDTTHDKIKRLGAVDEARWIDKLAMRDTGGQHLLRWVGSWLDIVMF